MTVANDGARGWRPFALGLQVRDFEVSPSDGPLRALHQPTATRIRGRLLISLSASTGASSGTVGDMLRRTVAELLDETRDADDAAVLETLRQEIWRMYREGRFDRAVPDIMAVVAGDVGTLRVWRAGPNGIAIAEEGRVRLLSEDLRMTSLQRLGACLDERWSKQPLLAEVSELTQIEPPDSSHQEVAADPDSGCVLLMSRGAMPFAAPSNPEATEAWWGRDAGWRHGLGGAVVAIASQRSWSHGENALSALAIAINEHRH